MGSPISTPMSSSNISFEVAMYIKVHYKISSQTSIHTYIHMDVTNVWGLRLKSGNGHNDGNKMSPYAEEAATTRCAMDEQIAVSSPRMHKEERCPHWYKITWPHGHPQTRHCGSLWRSAHPLLYSVWEVARGSSLLSQDHHPWRIHLCSHMEPHHLCPSQARQSSYGFSLVHSNEWIRMHHPKQNYFCFNS